MNFSEIFIRRPVMTVLLSASAVVAGVIAYDDIPIAALPKFETPTIQVTAVLPGASPDNMASSVATPLEKQFATISDVNVISSSSTQGRTQITLEFDQDRDIDKAAVDVQAALLRASRSLPIEMTSPPAYRKVNPADAPILFVTLSSPSMSMAELNSYADNLIVPTLSTMQGVAQIQVGGQKRYAVRVRMRPDALAARNLTMDDIASALKAANANTPVGTLEGVRQTLTIQANKQMTRAAEFARVIVATLPGGNTVRLEDVADVQDSVENVKTGSWSSGGEQIINLQVQRQPDANTVATVDAIRAAIPGLVAQMPASINLQIRNDRSISIRAAIHDVKVTLGITAALVVLVIFLFLRRPSATIIPTLSLPISLLGTIALMRALNLSLDNVSLLGITLAVGLVVDDAIVMLENIVRHVEEGMEPFEAALKGAREMAFTIFSISVSLVAVFIPIFFMPGVIGGLFHEFAIVVSLAILVSAGVSLTLVPMLASRYLKHDKKDDPVMRWTAWFERGFEWTLARYERGLDWALDHRRMVLMVAIATLIATGALAWFMPKGFFPTEDIGQVSVNVEAVEDISFTAMSDLMQRVGRVIAENPAVESFVMGADETNNGRMFIMLKKRGERENIEKALEGLRRDVRRIAGVNVYFNPIQNLRIGGRASKSRFQYVMKSVSAGDLQDNSDRLMAQMRPDPLFRDVTSDAQLKGLQAQLNIDRDKANSLGVNIQDIRTALFSTFGERQVSTIYTSVDSYQVILQAADPDRRDESAFAKIFVRGRAGALVPLSSLASVERKVGPIAINHAGQLQAITVSFNLAPGASLGDASKKIGEYRKQIAMPESILTSWAGDAAAFQSSQSTQLWLIVSALLVIYVLLGVLYESFIHPITIFAGLPSAAVGALAALWIFGMDLSIIATIGILMLIGIVKKNAIMMIDFALHAQREQGLSPHDAIRKACLLRFRPIMMTTLAAAMGAVPIAAGLGTGAELRQPLGLAVVGGLLFSQVITLFITPVIYLYLDRYSGKGPVTERAARAIPAHGD